MVFLDELGKATKQPAPQPIAWLISLEELNALIATANEGSRLFSQCSGACGPLKTGHPAQGFPEDTPRAMHWCVDRDPKAKAPRPFEQWRLCLALMRRFAALCAALYAALISDQRLTRNPARPCITPRP